VLGQVKKVTESEALATIVKRKGLKYGLTLVRMIWLKNHLAMQNGQVLEQYNWIALLVWFGSQELGRVSSIRT
jgi:hypothetical protein